MTKLEELKFARDAAWAAADDAWDAYVADTAYGADRVAARGTYYAADGAACAARDAYLAELKKTQEEYTDD